MTHVVVHSNIVEGFQQCLNESKRRLLKEVADEFCLDLKYLENKYLKHDLPDRSRVIEKRRYNADVSKENRCDATTKKGALCIKSRVDGCRFCQIHQAWKGREEKRTLQHE